MNDALNELVKKAEAVNDEIINEPSACSNDGLSLTWSTSPPVAAGYYWFRHPEGNGASIEKVTQRGEYYLVFEEYIGYINVRNIPGAEWAGPLLEPSER